MDANVSNRRNRVSQVYVVTTGSYLSDFIGNLMSEHAVVRVFSTSREFHDAIRVDRPRSIIIDLDLPVNDRIEVFDILAQLPSVGRPEIFAAGIRKDDDPPRVSLYRTGDLAMQDIPEITDTSSSGALRWVLQESDLQKSHREIGNRLSLLTPRESEILQLLVSGKSSREIAKEMGISRYTVSNHRSKIMSKILAENTADLVRKVMSVGWKGAR